MQRLMNVEGQHRDKIPCGRQLGVSSAFGEAQWTPTNLAERTG
jgi:hypothetical protein